MRRWLQNFSLLSKLGIYFYNRQNHFVLPCIKLNFPLQILPRLHISTFYKDFKENIEEIIHIQAVELPLKNVTEVEKFELGFVNVEHILRNGVFYLNLNKLEDTTCTFFYKISLYESLENRVCDISLTPLIRWRSVMKKPYLTLNCSRNLFKPYQKYCIYTFFSNHENCQITYPENSIKINFFRLLPAELDNAFSCIVDQLCEVWNASIFITTNFVDEIVSIDFKPWNDFAKCFCLYEIYLYRLDSPICNPLKGNRVSVIYLRGTHKQESRRFENVQRGNYCVLTVPCDRDMCYKEWSRNSNVIVINDKRSVLLNGEVGGQKFPPEVILATVILICIFGLGLWHIFKRKQRHKIFQKPQEKEGEEIIPLLVQPTEVYIFHSYDEDTKRKVHLLKDFFRNCANLNVFSIEDMLHKILPNPYNWFDEILECECQRSGSVCNSNRRFVIVKTERALNHLESKKAVFDAIEEKGFQYVLNTISIDWERCLQDYRHLFVVCFDKKLCSDTRMKYISPRVCYLIPDSDNLIDLCINLGSPLIIQRQTLLRKLENHPIRSLSLESYCHSS